jgi:adenine nucleotide transporter 17
VLYAGVRPAALETAASSAMYFWLYSLLRQAVARAQLERRRRRGGTWQGASAAATADADIGVVASLLVAALAGAGNQLVTTPAQVVTTQLQAIARRRRDLLARGDERAAAELPDETAAAVVCALVRDGGGSLGALWKGLGPSLLLVVNPAIQYALYEWLLAGARARKVAKAAAAVRGGAAPRRGPLSSPPAALARLSATEVFLLSALAKIGATVLTYPMIVVKSRLQAQGCATAGGGGEGEPDCGGGGGGGGAGGDYRGTADAVARIWREEGCGGFFAGMRAKILQTALNAALMLTAKDYIYEGTAAVVRGAVAAGGKG